MKSGLVIFNTLAVTLRTDDAGRMTLSPTTLYYKLTGELKIAFSFSAFQSRIRIRIHLEQKALIVEVIGTYQKHRETGQLEIWTVLKRV